MSVYSIPEMASMLDVCRETINKYIKRNNCKGIPGKDRTGKTILFYSDNEFEAVKKSVENTRENVQGLYTIQQIAQMAGVTDSCISNTASEFEIEHIVKPTISSRKCFFTKENAEKIVLIIQNRRDRRYKLTKQTSKTLQLTEATPEEHPLITNKEFLKLNVWPDVVPKCFADLDKEII